MRFRWLLLLLVIVGLLVLPAAALLYVDDDNIGCDGPGKKIWHECRIEYLPFDKGCRQTFITTQLSTGEQS